MDRYVYSNVYYTDRRAQDNNTHYTGSMGGASSKRVVPLTAEKPKGTFTRYDLSGRSCSRSVINLSVSTTGNLKLLQNNINSTT